ncbi:MAG: signal peptidase I [Chloroflexi bacterium]|nr:signal peptidase I [Chloroflexota bacterium]
MKFLRDIIVPIAVGLIAFVIFHTTVGSFKVYGLSMCPTVEDGEYILVSKAAYFFNEPHHGDIIVFRSPNDPNTDLIKRIIAVPGDTVEIRDKTVFVNDTPLVEPYIIDPPNYIYFPEEISTDHYFVLGDNRNNSSDSHKRWTVPRQNIIGKAWITYWPPYRWRLIQHYTLDIGAQAVRLGKTCLTMEVLCPTR